MIIITFVTHVIIKHYFTRQCWKKTKLGGNYVFHKKTLCFIYNMNTSTEKHIKMEYILLYSSKIGIFLSLVIY